LSAAPSTKQTATPPCWCLDGRHVEAVQTPRRLLQLQQLRQPVGAGGGAGSGVDLHGVGQRRVLLRQLQLPAAHAALRRLQFDAAAPLVAQPLLHDRLFGDLARHQHFARHVAVAVVEPRQQVAEQQRSSGSSLRNANRRQLSSTPPRKLQERDLGVVAAAVQASASWSPSAPTTNCFSATCLQRLRSAVSAPGRARTAAPPPRQPCPAPAAAAAGPRRAQDRHGAIEQSVVGLPPDQAGARRRTAADLVLDARPRAVEEHAVLAVAQRRDLVQQAQRARTALADAYGPK